MKYRYERKYYVSNTRLEELRERLLPFVVPDKFTEAKANGIFEYTVRSVYYDTPNMDFYFEKKEGLENRRKFRIRGYDKQFEGCKVFLEIKKKVGSRIGKHRALVPYDRVVELLTLGNVEDMVKSDSKFPKAMEDARIYLYNHFCHNLRPVNLVVYDREAYMGKFDPGVRITFDKNVRTSLYRPITDLYTDDNLKFLEPSYFVFEVKYYDEIPLWTRSLIEEFRMSLKAISKYADGLDSHLDKFAKMRFSPIGLGRIS
jgi:SPX domain protein involved in polyphosphate accumulation